MVGGPGCGETVLWPGPPPPVLARVEQADGPNYCHPEKVANGRYGHLYVAWHEGGVIYLSEDVEFMRQKT